MKRLLDFYSLLKSKKFTTLSGAIAFFFIVNGGSLIFLIAFSLRVLNIDLSRFSISGDIISKAINYFDENAQIMYKPYYFILAMTSIWSSSTLFYHLITAGEIIFEVKRKAHTILYRLISIFLVFIFLALMIVTIVTLVLSSYYIKSINSIWLLKLLQVALYIVIPLLIITFFMLFVPPIRLHFKEILRGVGFTIIFWSFVTIVFRIYLLIFKNYKAIYGALTFVIIVMIYIYLLAIGLIVGLIINLEYFRKIKN